MAQKPPAPLRPPAFPARALAAHVQRAVLRAVQAKLPERPASTAGTTAQPNAHSSVPAARPLAPHVRAAVVRAAQTKPLSRAALQPSAVGRLGDPSRALGTRSTLRPISAKAVIQRAAISDDEDDEIAAIFAGNVQHRAPEELKKLLGGSFPTIMVADNYLTRCSAAEIDALYGFAVTLSSGRAPRGSIFEDFKAKFTSAPSKYIAELMFVNTPAWDFGEVSASGQQILTYSKTTWDTKGTTLDAKD